MASPTTFVLGKGTVLSISPDGTTFTPVKQLKTISYSGNTTSFETITNMDSPGSVDEFCPTTINPGTAQCQGVFSPNDAGQILLAASQEAQTLLTVKMQMAPGKGQTVGFLREFTAYVQECNGPDAQFDKSATFSSTLKITGVKNDTPGS